MTYDENRISDQIDAGIYEREMLIKEIDQLRAELSTLREQNTAYASTMDNFYKEREALQGQISGLLDEVQRLKQHIELISLR